MMKRVPSRAAIVAQYDRIARFINLGYAITFPHRERLVRDHVLPPLDIRRGNTVLDLCCGAGHNLRYLVEAVGTEGRVLGIDLSMAMLRRADVRVRAGGWRNVTLIHGDAAALSTLLDAPVDRALVSFALALLPDRGAVLGAIANALRPGGRASFIEHEPFAGAARALNPLMWSVMQGIPVNVHAIFDGAARLRGALPEVFPDVQTTWHYGRGIWVATARSSSLPAGPSSSA